MASRAFRGLRERHVYSNNTRNPNSRKWRQAMADFKGFFPNMDADVIEAIFRSNNGAFNVTMNELLTISAEDEYDKLLLDPTDCAAASSKDKEPRHPDCGGNPAPYQQGTKGIPS